MKLTVHRQLSAGTYHVSFKVGEFTREEIEKMDKFGVPKIILKLGNVMTPTFLNQISEKMVASFRTQGDANSYEAQVVGDIRQVMNTLRELKDTFTSSAEVDV